MSIKCFSAKGSSLVEVMVSLFVFAIGILGVLSMQAQSVKLNNNAYLYSKANILAVQMVENLRASPSAAEAFESTLGASDCEIEAECCGVIEGGWQEATRWSNEVAQQLPDGQGRVVRNGDGNIEVLVCFGSGVNETTGEFVVGVVSLETLL